MTPSQHTIAGTVLTMPVKVRKATQHMAMFSVDADAAQRMIDYSGLQVARYLPGRAAVALILAHFIDGDLGEYHELSTSVMVSPPGSKVSGLRALQSAFIHHMLVDQAFTLEAGRTIWGFPKVMAEFTVRDAENFGFDVRVDGRLVVGMEFRQGLPVPSALTYRQQELRSYAHRDGRTLETGFVMSTLGSRYRPGGVRLRLGDHLYAKELAALGLPKRAMLSTSAQNVEMSFGDAQEVL
jgi:Acetoacetate decarboxylase (ADC)